MIQVDFHARFHHFSFVFCVRFVFRFLPIQIEKTNFVLFNKKNKIMILLSQLIIFPNNLKIFQIYLMVQILQQKQQLMEFQPIQMRLIY
jgi:hypothetical protein